MVLDQVTAVLPVARPRGFPTTCGTTMASKSTEDVALPDDETHESEFSEDSGHSSDDSKDSDFEICA